jgi:hypothetical protein
MNNPPDPNVVRFFRLVLTDPATAETELDQWSKNERAMLRSCAAQQAIMSGFQEMPNPAQISALASHMRLIFNEPIDTFALATVIESCFTPESVAAQRRLDSIHPNIMRRTAFLLPHGIYSLADVPERDVDRWVDKAVNHFLAGRQSMIEAFGEDYAEFYRTVCIDADGAARLLFGDDTKTPHQRSIMVYNAASGALHMLFDGRKPTREERDRLAKDIELLHGEFPVEVLEQIIDAFADPTAEDDWRDETDHLSVATLLPSTMVQLLGMTTMGINDFMRSCRKAEKAFHELD